MVSRRLTPALREQILAGIRAGGYPHVSAEAWGVARATFEAWLRGRRGTCAGFDSAVRQAHAQARLRAEIETFDSDPRVWLEHGPGRETSEHPGWSTSVKPVEAIEAVDDVLLRPRVMAMLRALLDALTPFPEARACAARRIQELG